MSNFGNKQVPGRAGITKAIVPKYRVHGPNQLLDHLVPLSQVENFLTELARLVIYAQDLREKMERLSTNMVNAQPVWETREGKGKYLRLVHPTKDGKRRREYVGNKSSNVREALERVENYQTYCALEREMTQVERIINSATYHWQQTVSAIGVGIAHG